MKQSIIQSCTNYLNALEEGNILLEVQLAIDGVKTTYDITLVEELVMLGDVLSPNTSLLLTFAHSSAEVTKTEKGELLIAPLEGISTFSIMEKELLETGCFRYRGLRKDVASKLGYGTMTEEFHSSFNKEFDLLVRER